MDFAVLLSATLLGATVGASCPDGFSHHGDSCYLFSHDPEEWGTAMIICNSMGAHLAEVTSAAESKYLSAQVVQKHHNFWIGGNDIAVEGDWMWASSGIKMVDAGFTNWNSGEPNNLQGEENCVIIGTTGHWYDGQCKGSSPYFICERSFDSEVIVG